VISIGALGLRVVRGGTLKPLEQVQSSGRLRTTLSRTTLRE